jgi:carboxyl-terminal processing protease
MWISLILASALMQQHTSTGMASLSAKVVDAIDRNYLYADADSWKRLRVDLLSNTYTTASSMDQQLAKLHEGDLRIITSNRWLRCRRKRLEKKKELDWWILLSP